MSVKVKSRKPKKICDLTQTPFHTMELLFPFKLWPTGHCANNVNDAGLLGAVVLQVHSVLSEHKQSLTPFQDIIQEYLRQPNKTTARRKKKTLWLASPRDGSTLRRPSKAKQKDSDTGRAQQWPQPRAASEGNPCEVVFISAHGNAQLAQCNFKPLISQFISQWINIEDAKRATRK